MSLNDFIKDLANQISTQFCLRQCTRHSTETSDSLIQSEHDEEYTTVSILRSIYWTL